MKAVEAFADTRLVGTEFDAGGANATAYAGRSKTGWRIALVNKDAARDLTVDFELPDVPKDGEVLRLTGPALDAIDGIRLDSSQLRARRGRVTMDLPRASAAVIRFG